jgi:hypothetical protein
MTCQHGMPNLSPLNNTAAAAAQTVLAIVAPLALSVSLCPGAVSLLCSLQGWTG